MSGSESHPVLIAFGSDENCTLSTCPVEESILSYRPSLPANVIFAACFGAIALVHVYLGWRWKSWGFMIGMILGCTSEIIGYIGRIMLWQNPFSFPGFMIDIVCLTTAPVFFTGSIYVTLSKAIDFFGPNLSRFGPKLFYYIFIPLDFTCLVLQAAGGALSTASSGSTGVDISMAGLVLQVIVLVIFSIAFADYMIRYIHSGQRRRQHQQASGWRFGAFCGGLTRAIVLILVRCVYRVAELQAGYDSKLFHEQMPFIVLEGVFIALAAVTLCFGHPGLMFSQSVLEHKYSATSMVNMVGDADIEIDKAYK
ncbi:RTA1 like domain-containing protein [Trichoderma velutinum]